MFGILHRARVKNNVVNTLRPLVEASLGQCASPGEIDWLAPQMMGALHRLITHHIWQYSEELGQRDCEVVALRAYGELSGVSDVFISAALKVHSSGSSDAYKAASGKADRLFATMCGKIDTADPDLRQAHVDAKQFLAAELSPAQRKALSVWPRKPGWHVAFLLWQQTVTEPMMRRRHAYARPEDGDPSHAQCEKIRRALETADILIDEPIPIVFANQAAVQTAARILLDNDVYLELKGMTWSPEAGGIPASHDDKLIAGLLAFHVQREFLRRIGLDEIKRFSRPLATVFGDISQTEHTVLLRELERVAGKLAAKGVDAVIERAIGAWIERPGDDGFEKIGSALRRAVATRTRTESCLRSQVSHDCSRC